MCQSIPLLLFFALLYSEHQLTFDTWINERSLFSFLVKAEEKSEAQTEKKKVYNEDPGIWSKHTQHLDLGFSGEEIKKKKWDWGRTIAAYDCPAMESHLEKRKRKRAGGGWTYLLPAIQFGFLFGHEKVV